jgi:uncharacterized protein (TIGR00730 family)
MTKSIRKVLESICGNNTKSNAFKICVFGGAKGNEENEFIAKAFELGSKLALKRIQLIYGGAKTGMMGAVADGILSQNGHATGILPKFLYQKQIVHISLSKLIVVGSMHQRKKMMYDLCDAFVVLPGGVGTMEELFEVLTWIKLGLINKPVALLNVNGFYNSLLNQFRKMETAGFIETGGREIFNVYTNIDLLIEAICASIPSTHK